MIKWLRIKSERTKPSFEEMIKKLGKKAQMQKLQKKSPAEYNKIRKLERIEKREYVFQQKIAKRDKFESKFQSWVDQD